MIGIDGNQFWRKAAYHLSQWHSERDWNIAMLMQIYTTKYCKHWSKFDNGIVNIQVYSFYWDTV